MVGYFAKGQDVLIIIDLITMNFERNKFLSLDHIHLQCALKMIIYLLYELMLIETDMRSNN